MSEANETVCSGGPKLVFACSGAADVGAVADQAARKLTKDGAGSMFCLAGVGGRVAPIMEKTASASKILAVDGCPLNCVAETLKQAGFDGFEHLLVTDCGLEKGKTEINDKNISKVVAAGAERLTSEA